MSLLHNVLSRIDEENAMDPNHEMVDGKSIAKELIYGHRMTEMLFEYVDQPSEYLQIAARGQHIKRWEIPRTDYSMDRKGYLKWRTQVKLMHAQLLQKMMEEVGYGNKEGQVVADLVTKKKLKTDQESKALEDVVCLVFLKYYFEDFAQLHEEEKVIAIVQKTWGKMTDKGHQAALKLRLKERESAIVKKALA